MKKRLLVLSCWGCRDALVGVPVLGTRISFALLGLGGGCRRPLKSVEAAGFLPETDVLSRAFFFFSETACKQLLWSSFMTLWSCLTVLTNLSLCQRKLELGSRFPRSKPRDSRLPTAVASCSHCPSNVPSCPHLVPLQLAGTRRWSFPMPLASCSCCSGAWPGPEELPGKEPKVPICFRAGSLGAVSEVSGQPRPRVLQRVAANKTLIIL